MDRDKMKLEKSVNTYSHAFGQPRKHQIVTETKSGNPSYTSCLFSVFLNDIVDIEKPEGICLPNTCCINFQDYF